MVRDVLQKELCGGYGFTGYGALRKADIERHTNWQGLADTYQTLWVKHTSGGVSELSFKSYDQGRDAFQGTKRDLIWMDEEPERIGIFTECMVRLTAFDTDPMLLIMGGKQDKPQGGLMIMTMTPLKGMTQLLIENFLLDSATPGQINSKGMVFVQAGWEDNTFLSEEERARLLRTTPEHELEARRRGIPSLGTGKVYPVPESQIVVQPFNIPKQWGRVYGLDFGWSNPTAAPFCAYDRDNDCLYVVAEYYQREATPATHANILSSMGGYWMPGVCDPSGLQSDKSDGQSLLNQYLGHGLKLTLADNSREAGIMALLDRMRTGRFKVFSTCTNWLFEFRLYSRGDDGRPKKEYDHLLDATRYVVMSGIGRSMNEYESSIDEEYVSTHYDDQQRNEVTGY